MARQQLPLPAAGGMSFSVRDLRPGQSSLLAAAEQALPWAGVVERKEATEEQDGSCRWAHVPEEAPQTAAAPTHTHWGAEPHHRFSRTGNTLT